MEAIFIFAFFVIVFILYLFLNNKLQNSEKEQSRKITEMQQDAKITKEVIQKVHQNTHDKITTVNDDLQATKKNAHSFISKVEDDLKRSEVRQKKELSDVKDKLSNFKKRQIGFNRAITSRADEQRNDFTIFGIKNDNFVQNQLGFNNAIGGRIDQQQIEYRNSENRNEQTRIDLAVKGERLNNLGSSFTDFTQRQLGFNQTISDRMDQQRLDFNSAEVRNEHTRTNLAIQGQQLNALGTKHDSFVSKQLGFNQAISGRVDQQKIDFDKAEIRIDQNRANLAIEKDRLDSLGKKHDIFASKQLGFNKSISGLVDQQRIDFDNTKNEFNDRFNLQQSELEGTADRLEQRQIAAETNTENLFEQQSLRNRKFQTSLLGQSEKLNNLFTGFDEAKNEFFNFKDQQLGFNKSICESSQRLQDQIESNDSNSRSRDNLGLFASYYMLKK